MTRPPATHCYIGVWPTCQCIRFVTVDDPEYAKDNAKEIARMMRSGYQIERVTIATFNAWPQKFGCKDEKTCPNPHAKKSRKRK